MRVILFFLWGFSAMYARENIHPWVVYYSNKASIDAFESYNPILLDYETHPSLQPLLAMNKEIIGYVNIGEVEERNDCFDELKKENALINNNPDWPGSWSVDIRNQTWQNIILTRLIPDLLDQGFKGIFLDQIDVSLELENSNPKKYKGTTKAAIDLILAMREKFPKIKIWLNRAYEILPDVGHAIDYELAETLYTMYNFQTGKYSIRTKVGFDWQMDLLNKAKDQFPHLIVFSLEYWDPKDTKMYEKIYAMERKLGLRPYVTTPFLDKIIPEPKS